MASIVASRHLHPSHYIKKWIEGSDDESVEVSTDVVATAKYLCYFAQLGAVNQRKEVMQLIWLATTYKPTYGHDSYLLPLLTEEGDGITLHKEDSIFVCEVFDASAS